MKTKRWICLLLVGALSFSALVGCASIEEIAPEEYGDWDGNYIYRDNTRSKTTGEDDEYLVESVTLDGVDYKVQATQDSLYLDDIAYLCLTVESYGDGETETETQSLNCLVEYDLLAQTHEVVYYDEEGLSPERIFTVHEDYIVLQREGWRQTPYYFKIDLDGNLLEDYEIAYSDCTFLGAHKEYIIKSYNKELFYCTWQDGELKKMLTLGQAAYLDKIELVGEGFLFRTKGKTNAHGLYYYDMKKGTTATLLDINAGKACSTVKDGYFVTGEEFSFTYFVKNPTYHNIFEKIAQVFSPEWLEFHQTKAINCTLYKIDYTAGVVEEAYRFEEEYAEKDFFFFSVHEGEIVFYAEWVEQGGNCQGDGGIESQNYTLNLNEKTLKKQKKAKESETAEEIPQGVSCGKYIYYTTARDYGGIMSGQEAYFIWRYDTETKESVCMQFFTDNEYDMERESLVTFRYAKKMWFTDYGLRELENFVVRPF